jgi:cytochrome c553
MMLCIGLFELSPRPPATGAALLSRCVTTFACILLGGLAAPAHAQEPPAGLGECAACHGADGIGRDVEIPNLAGQHEIYLLRQLQAFKSGKRPHKEMRYESRQLSDADMQALAHYYSRLPH